MTLDKEFPIHINIVKKLNRSDKINVDKNLLCKVINYIELTEEDIKQSDSEHENYVELYRFSCLILNLILNLFRKQISGPTQIDYTVDLI